MTTIATGIAAICVLALLELYLHHRATRRTTMSDTPEVDSPDEVEVEEETEEEVEVEEEEAPAEEEGA